MDNNNNNMDEENELTTKVEFADTEIEQEITYNKDNDDDDDDTAHKCVDDDDVYNNEMITIPPDGGWGWIIVIASFIIFLITEGIIYSYGVFFQVITKELNFTRSQISLIGAVKASSICLSGKLLN